MKTYASDRIRNVALTGHMGTGKTTLLEAMLFKNGLIPRMGSVEAKNTQSDYDHEEQHRLMSVNATVFPIEWNDYKINMLDCPGSRDFVGETKNAVRACELSLILVDAASGCETGTEFAWEFAHEYEIPCAFFVNKMDKERADFDAACASIAETFGVATAALCIPVFEGSRYVGVVDLMDMKAIRTKDNQPEEFPIPEHMKDAVAEGRRALVEAAAEGDDELTEKFLEGDSLTREEIMRGLREVLQEGRFIPVLCGSAHLAGGITVLQHYLVDACPAPVHRKGFRKYTEDGHTELDPLDPNKPMSAFVFKTLNDDYAGRLSFFKVVTGHMKGDGALLNTSNGNQERAGHLFVARGKSHLPVPVLEVGDIGAFAKIETTHTGDTLADLKAPEIRYAKTNMPSPTAHVRIRAKNRTEEDKLSFAIHRLLESDATLKLERDSLLKQTILSGMGESHLEVAVHRLSVMTKVEIESLPPRVQYRETITRRSEGQGKYKKQSGGRGQYGDCWVKFAPLERGGGFEFEWGIVGGVIPTNYKPSVEKGLLESMHHGVLAGYPMVDVKAVCFDGSFHAVDSSDMAFQVAASMAYKNVIPDCGPVILEPYMTVRINVPSQYMGDVMGYLSQHRGRISGNEQVGPKVVVTAEVPQGEMLNFSRDLRGMTQGRSVFSTEFSHYEPCPPPVQEKVVAEAKKLAEEEGH